MDIRKIKKLIELVEESGIAELEISEGEESVRISRSVPVTAMPQQYAVAPMAHLFKQHLWQKHLHHSKHQKHLLLHRVIKYFHQWWVRSTVHQAQKQKTLLK